MKGVPLDKEPQASVASSYALVQHALLETADGRESQRPSEMALTERHRLWPSSWGAQVTEATRGTQQQRRRRNRAQMHRALQHERLPLFIAEGEKQTY